MPTEPQSQLRRRTILIMAVACGVSVANVYFPQSISPLVADGLTVTPDSAALVPTVAQLGYAVGLFLLVPLGDRLPHRSLIVALLSLTGLGLLAASAAPTLSLLVAASTVIGLTTVLPQIMLPMAAGLAPPERRGAVMGTLSSGLIGGILLARAFGGTIGEWLGWRAPYVVAAALILLLAAVLTVALPATAPTSRQRYPALLATTLRLLRTEPELRRSCFYQAVMFGGFSAAWTSLALLVTGPRYGMGADAVGWIALVGAASMFCSPIAGRQIDRGGPDRVNLVCFLLGLLATAALAGGVLGGIAGLVTLAIGLLLLDVAVQCGQVANQSRIFALRPEFRSRFNTAYMTCVFLGGSAGSWLGVRTYTYLGWPGVCGLVGCAAVVALARHLAHRPALRRTAA